MGAGNESQGKNTVLIVDDEYHIGILIEKLIHWDELQMQCIGKATDGETALQIILEQHPDIVITDVRMPKITGLDLIQLVQKQAETNPDFIIISGYKEFEYAHQAIVYGVENYILKPVNEQELNQTLGKLRNKIDERTVNRKKEENYRKSEKEKEYRIRQDFLKNILDRESMPTVQQEDLPMTGDRYMGIDIKVDYTDFKLYNERQDELLIKHSAQLVEQKLAETAEELLICEKENLHLYCLINYQNEKSADISRHVNELLSDLLSYLLGYEQYIVTVGLGNPKSEFSQISYSILEANKAVCERLHCGTGRLIYYKEKTGSAEKYEAIFKTVRKEFLKAGDTMSSNGLEEKLQNLYGLAEEDDEFPMFFLYEWSSRLLEAFFAHVDYDETQKSKARELLLKEVQYCSRTAQIIEVMSTGIERFIVSTLQEIQNQNTLPIRKAVEYVNQHFAEKILLEDVAEIVELNPVYFSTLFKKEKGMNFSAYLIEVRMSKAKELLATTNDTVAAIGDSVGYADQKYFSQLFKKTVGVKPVVYRKMHT